MKAANVNYTMPGSEEMTRARNGRGAGGAGALEAVLNAALTDVTPVFYGFHVRIRHRLRICWDLPVAEKIWLVFDPRYGAPYLNGMVAGATPTKYVGFCYLLWGRGLGREAARFLAGRLTPRRALRLARTLRAIARLLAQDPGDDLQALSQNLRMACRVVRRWVDRLPEPKLLEALQAEAALSALAEEAL